MSKQSEAKKLQGYVSSGPTCGNCENFGSEKKLRGWMERRNAEQLAEGRRPIYSLERHGVDANLRCGLGGFAIKKTACCNLHKPVSGAEVSEK